MSGRGSAAIQFPDAWSPQRVDVEVWGGLGNRLFMLAAAFAVARRHQLPLRILTQQPITITQVLGGFDDQVMFDGLADQPQVAAVEHAHPSALRRGREKLGQITQRYGFARRENIGVGRLRRVNDEGTEVILLQGYFQSLSLVLEAVDYGWPAHLPLTAADADWARAVLATTGGQSVAGVHVRRGDYLYAVNQRRLGSATGSYYRLALQELGVNATEGIWLFSDDPTDARSALAGLSVDVVRSFGPDDTTTEAQALALMASTSCLVMSNSTFAWWGAFWGRHPRGVAYPRPWHDRVNWESLPSPGWLAVPKDGRSGGTANRETVEPS